MKTKILLALLAFTTATQAATILSEGFDDINTLAGAGWVQNNASTPVGSTNWFQGNDSVFPAYEGAVNSYIGANFNNVDTSGTIDNFLITPVLNTSASLLSFFTRSAGNVSGFPDRLRVLWSGNGASTLLSDFSTVLLDINSGYGTDFLNEWTNYSVAVPTGTGRLAFEYFVESGGVEGTRSDYIGIDSVTVTTDAVGEIPEPGSLVLLGGGLVALAMLRRKSSTRG
jgi:hypothetical protein